jgi:hypothetical protein
MRLSRGAWAWVIAWPVLLPLYAVWIILAPVVWLVRGAWRAITWD